MASKQEKKAMAKAELLARAAATAEMPKVETAPTVEAVRPPVVAETAPITEAKAETPTPKVVTAPVEPAPEPEAPPAPKAEEPKAEEAEMPHGPVEAVQAEAETPPAKPLTGRAARRARGDAQRAAAKATAAQEANKGDKPASAPQGFSAALAAALSTPPEPKKGDGEELTPQAAAGGGDASKKKSLEGRDLQRVNTLARLQNVHDEVMTWPGDYAPYKDDSETARRALERVDPKALEELLPQSSQEWGDVKIQPRRGERWGARIFIYEERRNIIGECSMSWKHPKERALKSLRAGMYLLNRDGGSRLQAYLPEARAQMRAAHAKWVAEAAERVVREPRVVPPRRETRAATPPVVIPPTRIAQPAVSEVETRYGLLEALAKSGVAVTALAFGADERALRLAVKAARSGSPITEAFFDPKRLDEMERRQKALTELVGDFGIDEATIDPDAPLAVLETALATAREERTRLIAESRAMAAEYGMELPTIDRESGLSVWSIHTGLRKGRLPPSAVPLGKKEEAGGRPPSGPSWSRSKLEQELRDVHKRNGLELRFDPAQLPDDQLRRCIASQLSQEEDRKRAIEVARPVNGSTGRSTPVPQKPEDMPS